MTLDPKLYSEACARNRDPILEQLQGLGLSGLVLEFASGTGMHAVHFAAGLPEVVWQPTDASEDALRSIEGWRRESGLERVRPPLRFDLVDDERPVERADAIFCANMIHVAPPRLTERVFLHAAELLPAGAPVVLYGPFRYDTQPLAPSNARFDVMLGQRYPEGGIRRFEWVDEHARDRGFKHEADVAMPANNRLQVWLKL